MDSFEWNKVFAAVLSAGLIIMFVASFSEVLYHSDAGETPAYTIEVASDGATEEVVVEEGPSLAEMMAQASVDKGARQFAKCKSCHTVEKGGKSGTGPNLYGILGQPVGGVDGFGYSSALASHGGQWTFELLDAWLSNPKNTIPGTSMAFAGIRKPMQRADLISYLRSFADVPVEMPAIEEVADAVEEAVADTVTE